MVSPLIFLAVIATSFSVGVQTADSKNVTVVEQQTIVKSLQKQRLLTQEQFKLIAYTAAARYGANAEQVYNTAKCEAPRKLVDGVVYYDPSAKSNYAEQSWGLAQWNLAAGNHNFEGTEITKAQATDAVYSINLMAHYFASGNKRIWSCYKKLYV